MAFSLGHLPPDLQSYVWTALPFIILASLGFIAVLLRTRQYLYLYLYLFLPLVAGYIVNQIFPFTPAYYERTLLLGGTGLLAIYRRRAHLAVGSTIPASWHRGAGHAAGNCRQSDQFLFITPLPG